ncbi:hypothetical protein [Xanthomonas campestris]|uniref:hypothetical protein n=1 Tax=Xanthomonas campestris TaxID=339 RepID=UPI001F2A957A|nr:hypothetical protein [Xanthomonas campestris]MCF8793625.1 hypothetical protein [Xanthomonas campestris pv. campestris]MEB1480352.1 hypothetical protein [Xanthomonas campestris pv. campestris]
MSMEFITSRAMDAWGWIKPRLWWIMLASGACLVLFVSFAKADLTKDAMLSAGALAGTALLSGGVFAWLTKVAQINGVFREELERVIYSERHALCRKDVGDLWAGVTRALHNDSFRGIEEKIYAAIKNSYLPTNKDFYYEDLDRMVQVTVVDKEKQIVDIELTFDGLLIPDRSKSVVKRPYEFTVGAHEDGASPEIVCELFTLDRVKIQSVAGEQSADNPLKFGCCLDIEGGNSVRISDRVRFRQCLLLDSVLMLRAASYVNGMKVTVSNKSDSELRIQHVPLGGAAFTSDFPATGMHRLNCEDLIFSGQGVMLTFQIL